MIPKFRMWNKITSKMHSVDGLYFDSEEVQYKDEVDVLRFIKFGNTILMQSTGIKDKNGMEIFEGDILKSNKYITSVFYERGAYCVKFCRTPNTTVTMNVISFIEKYKTKIVGNIYENPELLEDCK